MELRPLKTESDYQNTLTKIERLFDVEPNMYWRKTAAKQAAVRRSLAFIRGISYCFGTSGNYFSENIDD
jgi:hypothetical protein